MFQVLKHSLQQKKPKRTVKFSLLLGRLLKSFLVFFSLEFRFTQKLTLRQGLIVWVIYLGGDSRRQRAER